MFGQVEVKPEIVSTQVEKVTEKQEKWAIKVDVHSPVDDFYKRVPDMAYKVILHF